MKRLSTIVLLLFGCFNVWAQWLNSNVYDRPLKDVLEDVSRRYGVELVYKDKNVKGITVKYAPWRYSADVITTLENILTPIDFRFQNKGENRYEIKKWEYFRQSEEEGSAQLLQLWENYGTAQTWAQRRDEIKKNIIKVLGIDRFPKMKINAIRSNNRSYDKYSVENIALEILPGVYVSGSLYMPNKVKSHMPFMLSPHGHFYNKEDNSIPNERGRYRPDQQVRCATLAMMGVAVFSYDMWAWGESAMAFSLKDHRTDLGLIMQTWQSIRILDYFCSEPWVDRSRVGVTGASGGGTQTMIIAAIDERINLSVPVVMCSSHFYGGCPCESGLPIHILPDSQRTNNAELSAIVAPNPQLVISDGHDWTASVPKTEFPYLSKVYGLYGAKNKIENAHFPKEGHDYGPSKRAAMYDFLSRHWRLKEASEDDCVIEEAEKMFVFSGKLPENAIKDSEQLRDMLNQYR